MTRPEVPDRTVDAVEVVWTGDADSFLTRGVAPEGTGLPGRVLQSFVTVLRWSDVRALADGVATRRSMGTDLGGFAYPAASGASGGVVVYDGGDNEVLVSDRAFARLFSRLLDTVVHGASAAGDPATGEPWWSGLVAQAEVLRAEAS